MHNIFDFAMSFNSYNTNSCKHGLQIKCIQKDNCVEMCLCNNDKYTLGKNYIKVYSNKMTYIDRDGYIAYITFSNMTEFKAQLEKIQDNGVYWNTDYTLKLMLEKIDDYS